MGFEDVKSRGDSTGVLRSIWSQLFRISHDHQLLEVREGVEDGECAKPRDLGRFIQNQFPHFEVAGILLEKMTQLSSKQSPNLEISVKQTG